MRLADPRVSHERPVPRVQLDDGGFIMVALLVGIAISAIWMTALLPAWHQQETREREAELIFRGEQYARAIYLFLQKNQAPPPNIDTLVSQRYLRKKYPDPMTGKDFTPVGAAAATGQAQPFTQGSPQAGLSGVRSTSNEPSIVIYFNQQIYSQFPFDWTQEAQRSGSMAPQTGPGRGGPAGPGRAGTAGPGRGEGRGRLTGPGRGALGEDGATGPRRGGR